MNGWAVQVGLGRWRKAAHGMHTDWVSSLRVRSASTIRMTVSCADSSPYYPADASVELQCQQTKLCKAVKEAQG